MGGVPCNKNDLNKTLKYITNLLNKYNIKNWFIAYGTLLGIIRNDSCIDKDDDIDILVDKSNFDMGAIWSVIKFIKTLEIL